MAGTLRTARERVEKARELEARWAKLTPEQQADARVEWDALRAALAAVRTRLEYGPRGFVRELGAAYRGEEPEAVPDPRPLGALAAELHRATTAMRNRLDAAQ